MSVVVIKPLKEKQPRGESIYLVHSSGPFFRRSLAGRNFKQLVTSYPQPRAEEPVQTCLVFCWLPLLIAQPGHGQGVVPSALTLDLPSASKAI